ncbi:hypothetical protein JOF41_001800 [Saccharothrix coeruleofusca]|nr:hypothetical protein [Saccharothrix coeruleofusca]
MNPILELQELPTPAMDVVPELELTSTISLECTHLVEL